MGGGEVQALPEQSDLEVKRRILGSACQQGAERGGGRQLCVTGAASQPSLFCFWVVGTSLETARIS